MNQDYKSFFVLALVPLAAIVVIFIVSGTKMDLSLTPLEKRLLSFNSNAVPAVRERSPIRTDALRSPISLSKPSKKGFPDTPLSEISPSVTTAEKPTGSSAGTLHEGGASERRSHLPNEMQPPPEKKVTTILVNNDKKMAMIDGRLVSEGDVLDDYKVASIEKNRVLLKGKKGEKWLKLE